MTLMIDFAPAGLSTVARVLAAGLGGPAQEASSASALAAAASAFGEAGALLLREHPRVCMGGRAAHGSMWKPCRPVRCGEV